MNRFVSKFNSLKNKWVGSIAIFIIKCTRFYWDERGTENRTDHNLATTIINEFPCRPHWTKNTRDVLKQSVKNLNPNVSVSLVFLVLRLQRLLQEKLCN